MSTSIFPLPSGAQIELRPMTVADENTLASTKKRHMTRALNKLLDACCLRVVDSGPYAKLGQKTDWPNMLQGDRFAALLKLRAISYPDGAKYVFDARCPACGKRFEWEVDLEEELEWYELDEEGVERLQSGKPYATSVAGKKVLFNNAFGRDEERFEKLLEQHPGRMSSVSMEVRIKEVEGMKRTDVLDWLDGLTAGEAEQLREAFDDVECGVDTEIEIECPNQLCRHSYAVELPFDQFFTAGRKSLSRKRKRRQKRSPAQSESDS